VDDRLEYRFRWDDAEHRCMYRAVRRDVRRGSKAWLILKIWMGLFAIVWAVSLRGPSGGLHVGTLWPIAAIAAWIVFDRWGQPYLAARAYARDHAPCRNGRSPMCRDCARG
jgi:hypothetical protein